MIHSAGIGSVEFQPVVKGVKKCPSLGSNLLSLFHFTRSKGYTIAIEGSTVLFNRDKEVLFTATVTENNIGYLDGHAIIPSKAQSCQHSTPRSYSLALSMLSSEFR